MSRGESTVLYPAQWIQCDLRSLDMAILGESFMLDVSWMLSTLTWIYFR